MSTKELTPPYEKCSYQNELGCGVGSRFCAFIVKTSFWTPAPEYGSAIATEVRSCCGVPVPSPVGSVAMIAPGGVHVSNTWVLTLAVLFAGFASGLDTASVAVFVSVPVLFACTFTVIDS